MAVSREIRSKHEAEAYGDDGTTNYAKQRRQRKVKQDVPGAQDKARREEDQSSQAQDKSEHSKARGVNG